MNLVLRDLLNKKFNNVKLVCYLGLTVLCCNVYAKSPTEMREVSDTSLFQLGSASALLSGGIEGDMTYGQLRSKGDFGLGTFNDIDGEMVALDGNFYKISQKGKTVPVNPGWKTPFVELVEFTQSDDVAFEKIKSFATLKKLLITKLDNKNIPYALKVTGTFQFLKLRSRSQRKAHEVKDVIEETYSIENRSGTLVGFWFPEYLLTLTVPEFHFHFISDDKKVSGHVLELKAEYVKASFNKINQIELVFPKSLVFKNTKITAATLKRYNSSQMNNK